MKHLVFILALLLASAGYSQDWSKPKPKIKRVVEYNGWAMGGGYVFDGELTEAFSWILKTDEYGGEWTRVETPSPSFVLASELAIHHGLETTHWSIQWNKDTDSISINNLSVYQFDMAVKKTEYFENEFSFTSGSLTRATQCKGKMTVTGPLIEKHVRGTAELYFTANHITLTFKNIEFVFHRYRSTKWGDPVK